MRRSSSRESGSWRRAFHHITCAVVIWIISSIGACKKDSAVTEVEPPVAARAAQLVLRGGTVVTMDDGQSRAEAVAIADGKIVWVGPEDGADGWVGPETEVIDLDGHALLPGFLDDVSDTEDAGHKRAKLFDAFVAVAGGARAPEPVTVGWPVEATPEERDLLARICRRIAYIGRAESWAEVSVVDVGEEGWNCWPDERTDLGGSTTLLALAPADDLAQWGEQHVAAQKAAPVPGTTWEVIHFDAERYRRDGWTSIPGTRWVRYAFAASPFARSAVRRSNPLADARPTVARFAIRSAVLPRLEETLSVTDRLRQALIHRSARIRGVPSPVFTGHGEGMRDHQHAVYACGSDDRRHAGRIDHLVVSAKAGFDLEDVLTLQELRRIWGHGGHDLELILVGLGSADDLGGVGEARSRQLARSSVWESLTPYVPTRHPKVVRGVQVDSVEQQVARACGQFLGLEPSKVEPIGDPSRWLRFRRRRPRGGGRRGPDLAFGVRLTFDRPVTGPIALGYGAHVGLGAFVAVSGGGSSPAAG